MRQPWQFVEIETRDLARQHRRARIKPDETHLPVRAVKERGESRVDPAEAGFIEAESDGEFQRFARAGCKQRVVDAAVVREVGARAVD